MNLKTAEGHKHWELKTEGTERWFLFHGLECFAWQVKASVGTSDMEFRSP